MRLAQAAVLQWSLALADGVPTPAPELDDTELRLALLYTGLASFVGDATQRLGVELEPALRTHLDGQRAVVRRRHERYLALAPDVLVALDALGVQATPVKGLAFAALSVWPVAGVRPMADIDLLVPPGDRLRAQRVMAGIGLARTSWSATEDVYVAWGDGSAGPRDTESDTHNGKVELHPGWRETVHGYTIGSERLLPTAVERRFLGAPAWLLPPPQLVVHVLGHLSAGVIRREVRALNALDVLFCLTWLSPEQRAELVDWLAPLDERLWQPAVWFVDAVAPGTTEQFLPGLTPERPKRIATLLAGAGPADVLRSPDQRTPWQWRSDWTNERAEWWAAAREQILPPAERLRGDDSSAGAATLHGRRVIRASRRAARSALRRGPGGASRVVDAARAATDRVRPAD